MTTFRRNIVIIGFLALTIVAYWTLWSMSRRTHSDKVLESTPRENMEPEGMHSTEAGKEVAASISNSAMHNTDSSNSLVYNLIQEELGFFLSLKLGVSRSSMEKARPQKCLPKKGEPVGIPLLDRLASTGPPLSIFYLDQYRFDEETLSHTNVSFVGKPEMIRVLRDRLISEYTARYGDFVQRVASEVVLPRDSVLVPMLVWTSEGNSIALRHSLDLGRKLNGYEGVSIIMESGFLEEGDKILEQTAGQEHVSFFDGVNVSENEKEEVYRSAGLAIR